MKNILTGIKPTGQIHLGNYIGAIKPALKLSKDEQHNSFYFVADYHGLTKKHDGEEMRQLSYGIAATWLALGLDPNKVTFYRQSDVPEIFELTWILSCFAPKGLMNRAHAYKSIIEQNQQQGKDQDDGFNIGIFTYPILMAADILMFKSNIVPVGKDQVQHVEIARDIAISFNKNYGDIFVIPEYSIEEESAVLPGLDGRKMSKSYNNTIPLFEEPKKLKKLINKIKTDSSLPGEPKEYKDSILFSIYKEFATDSQIEELKLKYANGISWGEAKEELYQTMNSFLEGPRDRYHELMSSPQILDDILLAGADKARAVASPLLKEVRRAVGMYVK